MRYRCDHAEAELASACGHLAVQPSPSGDPIRTDDPSADPEPCRDIGVPHPTEEPHLNHGRHPGLDGGELIQQIGKLDEFLGRHPLVRLMLAERDPLASVPALGIADTGVINEDLADDLARPLTKDRLGFERPIRLGGDAKPCFMDDGGGLEGVPGGLSCELGLRDRVQMGQQFLAGVALQRSHTLCG